uniref:Uncharacterized protein n=1 Tax=Faecalibaculum rodentium TaxID=1702221 RepID=A0A140DSW4_9FIRM|nr:hypothetical protein AALO17_06070 [Faecalibaculum rodentium]
MLTPAAPMAGASTPAFCIRSLQVGQEQKKAGRAVLPAQ